MRPALSTMVLLLASAAAAQGVASSPPAPDAVDSKPVGETWQARLRYGIAYRTGAQQDLGPGLTYQGVTPNDLSFLGWAWLGYVGLHAQVQREAFSLSDAATQVTNGSLLRIAGQLGARLPLGPLRIEPYLGYAFHQLPTFRGADGSATTLNPTFGAATRHALLTALRLLVEVSIITVELRGEVPIALATQVPGAVRAASNGFGFGGGLRFQLLNAGSLHVGALVDAQYVVDNLVGKNASEQNVVDSQQRIVRAGLGLDLQWRDPVVSRATGGVVVRVVDLQSGVAIPGADVTLTVGADERPVSPDAQGALAVRELPPGPFTLRASAEGYLPFESAGSVTAGSDTAIEVKLQREAPKVGALNVVVTERDTKKPLPGVMVTAGDVAAKSDEKGVASFEGLKPGPVSIVLKLDGYQPGDEAASVVAGKATDVAVALVPAKKRVPATITGFVRSTKGGAAISADLELPQAKLKTKADAKGAFTFQVPGGTYTVKISAPGYQTQSKDVTVRDGDQAIFNVDLYPK
ncbi:MAG: carboxypeptidase regulatory-like domain-containing protein [Myxococcaceae bacterium]|nr:carboxypeptidase regulatory-like domain-containing protein [Myxococcaceae bacterium]